MSNVFQNLYEKKGLEFKPLPKKVTPTQSFFQGLYEKKGLKVEPSPRVENSTQDFFQGLQAKRDVRVERERIETMIRDTNVSFEEAQKAAGWKRIAKETIKGLPEAAPVMFKKLATKEGVEALGRGYVKGISLGYLTPETPEEADEIEQAIEAGWEAAGFFTTFLGIEGALNTVFKTPVIASKLGKAAPYIARASAWLGTSQLHADLRGAPFEERAKQAGIDAATLLVFEGLAWGIGKGISKVKTMRVPAQTQKNAIKYFQNDLIMKFGKTGRDIPGMAKYAKGINLSGAKTLTEAMKIFKSKIPASLAKNPLVGISIRETFNTAKSVLFQIVPGKVGVPMARIKKPLKVPKLKPKPEVKFEFKISPTAELKALLKIQKSFPQVPSVVKRIQELKTGIKPIAEIPKIRMKPSEAVHDIARITKTTLETPTRIVAERWKALKLPSHPYMRQMEAFTKTLKIKEYSSLGSFAKKIKPVKVPSIRVSKPKVAKISEPKVLAMKELAYFPEKFRKPKAQTITTEAAKIVKRSEIAREISEQLNVPIRTGKFRLGWGKKARGIYKIDPEIIRIKEGGFPVVAHEVGHHIDKSLGYPSSNILKKERDILLKEYGGKPKGTVAQKEAFAEFMRFYITDPKKALKDAPVFSEYFKKKMEGMPEVHDVILQARRDYQRWIEMPATSKILSQISMKEAEAGVKEKVVNTTEKIYIAAKDDLFPLKQFSALAKGQLGDIPKRELPYIMARIMRGWVGKANVFLEKGTFEKKFWTTEAGKINPVFTGKSFKDILKPIENKGALEEFSIYLTAKRAVELNRRKINTGIETQDALEALNELLKKYPEFTKTSQELYKFQDAVLKYGYQSGLYDIKTLIKIKEANRWYVPFYRVFEEMQSMGYYGKGYVNMSNSLKRMKGSEREIINPLESIVKNTYTIISVADRNAVGVQMANLAARNRELGRLFEQISVPVSKVATISERDLPRSMTGFWEGGGKEMVDIFRPSIFLPKDNVVTVLIAGKKHFYQVDPMLYNALASTEKESMGVLIKLLSYPTRWLRAGAILAPEFMVRNPIRDVWGAFVYSKYNFFPPIDFTKGLFGLVAKDKDYWLWRMGGGEHAMFVSIDRTYLQKSFSEVVKGRSIKGYVKNPLEALRILSEMSEVPTRLGEFKKGIGRMKDPIEAAYASREISLDFAKLGNTGRALNRIIAFWNASAESWDKLIREHKKNPTKTMFKAISGITIPSVLLYLSNRDDPRWKEIPQWQKDLCWIIMTEDHIYKIPRPFQLGLLYGAIPERVLEYLDTKDPEKMKQLAENILLDQSPGIMPTALTPIIENWSNYNFFLDRPIVPESRKALPPEAQYTSYTSEAAKILGKAVNYSPAKIDNLFRGYFAGLGKHTINAIDGILMGTGISTTIEPTPTLADKPIAKAFVVRRPIGSSSASVESFYKKYNEYESFEKLMKEHLRNDEKEKFYALKNEHPELFFTYDWERKTFYSIPARYYRSVARDISELRKAENKVYTSQDLTPNEKREKIDKIDELITKVAAKALEFDIRR